MNVRADGAVAVLSQESGGAADEPGGGLAPRGGPSSFPCFGETGTCTWAPQLHDGFIYVSDVNSGIWKLLPALAGDE